MISKLGTLFTGRSNEHKKIVKQTKDFIILIDMIFPVALDEIEDIKNYLRYNFHSKRIKDKDLKLTLDSIEDKDEKIYYLLRYFSKKYKNVFFTNNGKNDFDLLVEGIQNLLLERNVKDLDFSKYWMYLDDKIKLKYMNPEVGIDTYFLFDLALIQNEIEKKGFSINDVETCSQEKCYIITKKFNQGIVDGLDITYSKPQVIKNDIVSKFLQIRNVKHFIVNNYLYFSEDAMIDGDILVKHKMYKYRNSAGYTYVQKDSENEIRIEDSKYENKYIKL